MEYDDLRRLVAQLSAKIALEQDVVEKAIRMSEILENISTDSRLAFLSFKGGTALNFVYLKTLKRLSIDLDFNAIGLKEKLLNTRDSTLTPAIHDIAKDMGYDIEVNKSYSRYGYRFRYDKLSGEEDYIKIEISFRDRVAVLPVETSKFHFPEIEKTFSVRTLSFTELFAEKLRALYTRERGRDLFDVYNSLKLVKPAMHMILKKTLIYKLFRADPPVVFKPEDFLEKVKNFQERRYADALRGFVPRENQVLFVEAREQTIKALQFLKEIDGRDRLFIGLFRCLLGQDVSKDLIKKIRNERGLIMPLHYLFDGKAITEMAKTTKLSEILPVLEPAVQKYPWLDEKLQR